VYEAVEGFTGEYGLYLLAFCMGVVAVLVAWMVKHPEEFFERGGDEDDAETESSDER
jgi:hypothetical protein